MTGKEFLKYYMLMELHLLQVGAVLSNAPALQVAVVLPINV